MMFLKSLKIWGLTSLLGSIFTTVYMALQSSSSDDSFLQFFVFLAFFGAIFSLPAILVIWPNLELARRMRQPFDRTLYLVFSTILANMAVLAIITISVDGRFSTYAFKETIEFTAGHMIASFIAVLACSRDIIFQPYPEFLDEQRRERSDPAVHQENAAQESYPHKY